MADLILSGVDSVLNLHSRREDLEQRKIQNVYRDVADARRQVDLKAQQLKAISNLSALVGGFAMVVLVEGQIDSSVAEGLLMAFGAVTAAVVGFMLMTMLNCSLILLHVLNFPAKQSVIAISNGATDVDSFAFFWRTRCEEDWRASYKSFRYGVSLFVVSLALLGWVKFHQSNVTAILVTAVAACTILYWWLHTKSKWRMPRLDQQPEVTAVSAMGSAQHQPQEPPLVPDTKDGAGARVKYVPKWKREGANQV